MGHSTIRVTMDVYAHIMQDTDNEATEKLAAIVFGGSKTVATGDAASQEASQVLENIAGIAQLVEHNLAKVGVASSSLVSRSSSAKGEGDNKKARLPFFI